MRKAVRILAVAVGAALTAAAGAATLVVNPDFDEGLDGWTADLAAGGRATVDTANGWPGPPSAHLFGDALTTGVSLYSSCMAIDDSANVDLYVDAGIWSGWSSFGIVPYSDADCTTPLEAIRSEALAYGGLMLPLANVTLPAGTAGAKVVLSMSRGSLGEPPDGNFDHIQFGPAGTVAGINADQEGLSGTWYDPETSGQGVQLEFFSDGDEPGNGLLFGAWYTYGTTPGGPSSQRWYSFLSALGGDMRTVGFNIYLNTGGNFAAPPTTSSEYVGTGFMTFDSCESGTFEYSMNDGRTGTIPLQRLLPNIGCVEDGTPSNPPSDFGLSGAWYDTATSGQGILVEVNPESSQVFLGWYSYPVHGETSAGLRWFSGQGSYTVGTRSMDLTLYASQNGIFDSAASTVLTRPVGTATLTYSDCEHATFDYAFASGEFEGKHGTIAMSRLDRTPHSCSFDAP